MRRPRSGRRWRRALVQRDGCGRKCPIRDLWLRDANGVRASGLDHAVEDGHPKGGLGLLTGQLTSMEAAAEDTLIRECRNFRVWAITMGPKEAPDGTTEATKHTR